ncbi:MAG: hypothetical protein OEV66_06960 [Spirochaetia bacterium]|nr:hypothetical protein [Spirochaetia bacterium]
MKKGLNVFALTIFIVFAQSVYAAQHKSKSGLFTITLSDGASAVFGGLNPEQLFAQEVDSLLTTLDKQVNTTTLGDTLKMMANSQDMATRGLGVTYGTNHKIFIISASVNAGAGPLLSPAEISNQLSNIGPGRIPSVGIGAQASVVLGVSLKQFGLGEIGFFKPENLNIFVNYFTLSVPVIPVVPPIPVNLKTDSFGLHVQYKIIEGSPNRAKNSIKKDANDSNEESDGSPFLFYWGGLDITTGMDFTSNKISMDVSSLLPSSISSGTTNIVTFNVPQGSSLTFTNGTATIPIEVSTSVRLLSVFTFMLGGGVDINMGSSDIGVNDKSGNAKLDIMGSTGGTPEKIGSVTVHQKAPSAPIDARVFLGAQINLIPLNPNNVLSLSVIASLASDKTVGVHVGLNMGF